MFFENKFTYGMKSPSRHFDKEIYQYINITWLLLTGKHLCWSLFLILSITKLLRAVILKNVCERLLLKMCSWNWENLFIISFNFTLKNRFFQHQCQRQVHFGYFMIGFPWSLYSRTIYSLVWREIKLQTKKDQKFKKRICHVNGL